MSQEDIGEKVGITFQQIQKYEKGQNRIGASRLYDFAKILGIGVEDFFEDIGKPQKEEDACDKNTLAAIRMFNTLTDKQKKAALHVLRAFHETD